MFAGRQREQFLTEGKASGVQIIGQHPAALLPFTTQHTASQQRFDPGFQFGQFERLGEVVVGAKIEAMHPIFHIAARRQHQHRQIFPASPQPRQHLKSAHARQADIEDRHGVFLTAQCQIGSHAIVQHIHGQTGALERLGDAFGQLQMVFDEQNTHGFLPRSGMADATLCRGVYSRNRHCEARKH